MLMSSKNSEREFLTPHTKFPLFMQFSYLSIQKFDLIMTAGLHFQSLLKSKCLLIRADVGM